MTNVPIYLVVGSPAECVSFYMVEYKLSSDAGYTSGGNQTTLPLMLYNLLEDAIYNVRVTPMCCNQQYGDPLIFNVSTTGLDTPTGFIANPGDMVNVLEWDDMADATNYIIERALDAGFTSGLTEVYNGIHVAAVNDDGLTNGVQYFYRIKSQASGYPDSAYAYDDGTPVV